MPAKNAVRVDEGHVSRDRLRAASWTASTNASSGTQVKPMPVKSRFSAR